MFHYLSRLSSELTAIRLLLQHFRINRKFWYICIYVHTNIKNGRYKARFREKKDGKYKSANKCTFAMFAL